MAQGELFQKPNEKTEDRTANLLVDILRELQWQSIVLEKLLEQGAVTLNKEETDLGKDSFDDTF